MVCISRACEHTRPGSWSKSGFGAPLPFWRNWFLVLNNSTADQKQKLRVRLARQAYRSATPLPAEPCSFASMPTFQQKPGSHTQSPVRPHARVYTAFNRRGKQQPPLRGQERPPQSQGMSEGTRTAADAAWTYRRVLARPTPSEALTRAASPGAAAACA